MGDVFYAKSSVEKFKWLNALIKTYQEAAHEVGVDNDGPQASNQIFKMIKKSFKLKTKMK